MTVLEIATHGHVALRRIRRQAEVEHLPDMTIDDLVGVAPLPATAALAALREVAATLQAMHDRGLAHGEVRPSRVYVLDDGRAALARPRTAPLTGRTAHETAVRGDAYAFAALAFELLTGAHPLRPSDARSMSNPLTVLPPQAATVLRRALRAKRDKRPLPLDLVADLEAIAAEDWASNRLSPAPTEAPVEADGPRALEPPARLPMPAIVEPFAPVPTGPVLYRYRVPTSEVVVRVVPARPRKSVIRRIVATSVVTLGLVTVFTGGAAGAKLLFSPASADDPLVNPPEVRRASVSVTPPQAQCPRAAMHVAATIVVDGGEGDLVVRWRLPDGSLADTQTISVDDGDTSLRTAIDLTFAGTDPVVGDVVAIVSPGGIRASAPIRYVCPGANRGDEKSRGA